MKKLSVFLCAMTLVFVISGMARAELLLFEDFEDSSGFTLAGCVPAYWGIAPLSGTPSIPSEFEQGSSSQSGMIFYGSQAKENDLSPAATVTIILPDLSGYTNLELTVALAAAVGKRWEPTHRDSLHIIGGTTTSPPYVDCSGGAGCVPVADAIDSFLPIAYPDFLWSNVHSIPLGHQFQDFEYTIDSSLKSLTFAFASTAEVEVIGIDSVKITGDLILEPVVIDIKPQSCPNPLNTKSQGVLPVAILGTDDFDVTDIDAASIRLAEVAPVRSTVEDVATPVIDPQNACDCNQLGGDGIDDLTLKFNTQEIVAALGEVQDGKVAELALSGVLTDGTPFEGKDCIVILAKGGKGKVEEPDQCYAGVPKTGQTISYAMGDDGDLQKGVVCPEPRFTDNEDGTVTDNCTGLVWLKNANCNGAGPWQRALDFVEDLNNGIKDCGQTNKPDKPWRTPNVKELQSLINYGSLTPALPSDHPFTNVVSGVYWASTSYAEGSAMVGAWGVFLGDGTVYPYPYAYGGYGWAVRGGY